MIDAIHNNRPSFGALNLKTNGNKVEFSFVESPTSEHGVSLNGKLIGNTIHAEFPLNYLPHFVEPSDKREDCLSSMAVTIKAALLALREHALLEAFFKPFHVSNVQAKRYPKTITGTLSFKA